MLSVAIGSAAEYFILLLAAKYTDCVSLYIVYCWITRSSRRVNFIYYTYSICPRSLVCFWFYFWDSVEIQLKETSTMSLKGTDH